MADDEPRSSKGPAADLHTKWMGLLDGAEKDASAFRADVKRVIRACGLDRKEDERAKKRFEIAWANRDILQGAVYDRPPKGVVQSRYRQGDALARSASDVMERAVNTNAEMTGVHDALIAARDEFVDFGRGTVWLRYEPQMETREEALPPGVTADMLPADMETVEGEDGALIARYEAVTAESALAEFVPHELFRHGKGRVWKEVPWVARGKYYTREMAEKELPFWKKLDFKADTKRDGQPDKSVLVWEIWSKPDDRVFFVSPAAVECLDDVEPFLRLDGFFPCPPPALGTCRDKSLLPIPDVIYYESQLQEINQLTGRINALLPALKVRGFYSAGASRDGSDAIEAALKTADDRQVMVPVPGWAAMGDKKDLGIAWMPIDMVVQVLQACVGGRKQLIEDVYQITGISDIIRGDSNPNETLGAQQLKTQWGGLRLRRKQSEMARFARDVLRIQAEIIAEHFSPDTILRMTQWQPPTPKAPPAVPDQPPMMGHNGGPAMGDAPPVDFEQIIAVLRDDRMRGFTLDVETDSTIVADEAQDKKDRIEFGQTIGAMLQQAAPLVMQAGPLAPEMGKIVGETMKFVVRGFRAGRELEQVIDDALAGIETKLAQPPAPPPAPPDPNEGKVETAKIAAEARIHDTNTRAETERQRMMLDHQRSGAEMARDDMHRQADRDQRAAEPPPTVQ